MALGPRAKSLHRSAGWSDIGFAPVAEIVRVISGLVFPPNRQPSAEAAMRRVMGAFRLPRPEDLAGAIAIPGEIRESLMAELTIGESYFFRDWSPLSLLPNEILPQRAERGGAASLRIWSAGCSTGEEPYSLAIRLRELGESGNAIITGTDIARPRLDAAKKGRYTKWSLRGVSPERITTWFARKGTQYLLDDTIRASVTFRALNLAADEYGVIDGSNAGQDLILCRNVLIYFEMDTVASIATKLLAALRPDGWLILGASDPPLVDLVDCQAITTPGGIAYRRIDAPKHTRMPSTMRGERYHVPENTIGGTRGFSGPDVEVILAPSQSSITGVVRVGSDSPALVGRQTIHEIPPASVTWPPDPSPVHAGAQPADPADAYGRGDYSQAATLSSNRISANTADPGTWVTLIRSLANLGNLTEAGERASAAIEVFRLEPELHYLHAMLLLQAGKVAESITACRRALYLDRTMVMAHMLLADGLGRLKQADAAKRAFLNALSQLDGLADDVIVPAADGVVVNRIRQIARERVRLLTDNA